MNLTSYTDYRIRRLLWILHGHTDLIAVGPEMRCVACRLDFLNDPLIEILDAMDALGKLQAPAPITRRSA